MVISMNEKQEIEKLKLQNYVKAKEIEILRINIINLNKEKNKLEENLKKEKERTFFDFLLEKYRRKK